MKKRKLKQFLITIATLSATAAVNYSLMNNPFVFVVILILFAHELGHYFVAKLHDGDPDLPYLIPFPLLIVGITRIRNMRILSNNSKRKILFYGPFVGFISSIMLLILSYLFFPVFVFPLAIMATAEVILNYFGSDGKKYRMYKEQDTFVCI